MNFGHHTLIIYSIVVELIMVDAAKFMTYLVHVLTRITVYLDV